MTRQQQDPDAGWRALARDSLSRSGLKLSHLRIIVALEETRRISGAAQMMNIAQPAASRLIAEMESMLGASLCERLPRGVELTAYGLALARRARSILFEMRQIDREFADLRSGNGGTVFLGSVTGPAIDLAAPAIRQIRTHHPRVQINLQVETSSVLARELFASRLDLVIARVPEEFDSSLFESRVIGVERAALIVRRGHRILKQAPVTVEQLYGLDWVLEPTGSVLRRTIEALFLQRDLPLPDRILNTSSILMTLVMVMHSDAVAPVSTGVAKFVSEKAGLGGEVDIVPIDFEMVVQPYSLIQMKERSLSPAAQSLRNLILNEVK